jgi:two-component system CheB/CheR fusion protein
MSSDLESATSSADAIFESKPVPMVVGIGGSAGALSALMALLESLDGDAPLAIVVVLHLSPDHESSAVEILQRVTPLSVSQVRTRTLLQAGHVYVIAPGMNLITKDGHVQPDGGKPKRPSAVVDLFFRTLADVHAESAVGIVLSGTGRDGALGLSQINERGGLTIAQAPEDCEHPEMPRAAIATGVDLVLPAAEIGKRLVELARFPRSPVPLQPAEGAPPPDEPIVAEDPSPDRAVHDILAALRIRTRHDFRHYKRATVMRRLERRVQVHRLAGIQEYRDFVRAHPEELGPLLADMLISVTNFFRDPKAFEVLQRDVIRPLLESVSAGDEARVWVPACASGEESYSVAILLQEIADGMQQPPPIQLFASDINDAALTVARAGVYSGNIAVDVTEPRLAAYFEKDEGGNYRVRPAVREMIVFARHNVLADPPFSRLDLICCRNLLIYLDRAAQAAVLDMFAYALKPGGYLFLGNAESVDAAGTTFEPISKEHRIYRLRADAASTRLRIPLQVVQPSVSQASVSPLPATADLQAAHGNLLTALHERALVATACPSVLIDAQYELERVSPGASRFVAFGEGAPTHNLLNNVAADIRMELRAALFRASETHRSVKTVFRRADGDAKSAGTVMALSVHPVKAEEDGPFHWLVVFDDSAEGLGVVPEAGAATEPAIQRLQAEIGTLKAHLQDTLDRAATSSEELKASNEELQAINEELRSAKEELETSREELQSLNEELTTVNFELRMKVDESSRNNDDLRNLMEASEIATVFVDAGMRIKRYTPQAKRLFALIPGDVGRPLMDITSQLKYDEIADDAAAAFRYLRPVERSVTTLEGEHFLARVLPYRTSDDKIGGAVLTFIDVTRLRRAEHMVALAEERLREAVASSKDFAVISTDDDGTIMTWNEGATRMFGHEPADIVGQSIDVLFTPADRAGGVPAEERRLAARDGRAPDERWHLRSDGTTFFCSGVMTPLHAARKSGFLKIARDVSEGKRVELQQLSELNDERRARAKAAEGTELRDRFLAVMSHELKQPLNLIQVNAELLTRLPEISQFPVVHRIGGTIMRAVSAQETIVNDLLEHSRIQTGKMRLSREPTDLVELVRTLVQAMATDGAGKGITLNLEAPQRVICDCDPVRIEQVVWNLLGNAVKFTPEKGRIAVALSVDEGFAKLEVTDTGAGIAPEYLPRVFELFSQGAAGDTVGPRRAGLGIGLALVRELVQAHGGRVQATSPGPGLGATFSVWLPRAARTPETKAVRSSSLLQQRRILMVDDEADSLATFAMLLQLEGASVDTTTSPKEALKMLETGDYDLLLSDIGMPEMSGIEFLQRARELDLAKPFRSVAITGFGSEGDFRDTRVAGFDGHISKPISLDRLRAVLEQI